VFDDYQLARVRGLESMIEEGVRQGLMAPHNPRLVSEAILGAAHRLRNQQFLADRHEDRRCLQRILRTHSERPVGQAVGAHPTGKAARG
jgi:hypothetical protein